jgi:hypothetical protein
VKNWNQPFTFMLFSIWLLSTSPVLAQTCDTLRGTGLTLVDRVEKTMSSYERKAADYNVAIKAADQAYKDRADINEKWPQVILKRDILISSTMTTLGVLADMNAFNKNYQAAGCFESDLATIEADYQQTISPFTSNLVILHQVPDDWRKRYQSDIASSQCKALDQKAKSDDVKGASWAQKYDPLIEAYDIKRASMDKMAATAPDYSNQRNELLSARDKALPGVIGYSDVLNRMFENAKAKRNAGCIAMTDTDLENFRARNDNLLAEIQTKADEMMALETSFPVTPIGPVIEPKPRTVPVETIPTDMTPAPLPVAPAPSVVISAAGPITMRNASGNILCIHQTNTLETVCNFMPGTVRTLTAMEVMVFGGGYWTQNQKYRDMKVCQILNPSSKERIITRSISPGCTPSAQ